MLLKLPGLFDQKLPVAGKAASQRQRRFHVSWRDSLTLNCVIALIWIGCFLLLCESGQASAPLRGGADLLSARPSTVALWPEFAPTAAADSTLTLPQIAREVMAIHFGVTSLNGKSLDEFARCLPVKQEFDKPAGVFVTLSSHGKTRACWGAINPQSDTIAKSTVYATVGALTKEYRYRPIKRAEWKQLKVQVTVIKAVEPITSVAMQNPLRDGLLVRAGGRAGVLLPGEACDSVYQLVQCKLKAGIKPGEPCQLYRLRTDIYE